MTSQPYLWSKEATQLAQLKARSQAPRWLDEEKLPEVLQRDSNATVPFEIWRGLFAQGELLFDVRSDWWGRHDTQRTKQGGELLQAYTPEERDTQIATIQAFLETCEPTTLENFWLSIWELWDEEKKPDRAWFLPTMALLPCRANAFRLLGFYLSLSDCYLVRNMGQQQSARMLTRWDQPAARYVLDQATHRMREDYERKALKLAIEDELVQQGTTLDAWLTPKPEADLGLDEQGQRIFDLGSRQIEMTCSLSTRTITWRELPAGKQIKSFPRKKKSDDPLLFSLSRLRYRSLREELERAYL